MKKLGIKTTGHAVVKVIIMNKFFGGILRLKIDIIQMVFLLNEFAYEVLKNLIV